MAKLTGHAIKHEVECPDRRIIIDPWHPENVGPNSVDLTLSNKLMTVDWPSEPRHGACLDMKKKPLMTDRIIPPEGFVLQPKRLYLGATNERAGSDFFVPCIEGRSSIARLGLVVHMTAGFGDLGFKGCWTLEMTTLYPLRIYAGVRICQVYFDTVEGKLDQHYDKEHHGKYGGQSTPEPIESRLYMDFADN